MDNASFHDSTLAETSVQVARPDQIAVSLDDCQVTTELDQIGADHREDSNSKWSEAEAVSVDLAESPVQRQSVADESLSLPTGFTQADLDQALLSLDDLDPPDVARAVQNFSMNFKALFPEHEMCQSSPHSTQQPNYVDRFSGAAYRPDFPEESPIFLPCEIIFEKRRQLGEDLSTPLLALHFHCDRCDIVERVHVGDNLYQDIPMFYGHLTTTPEHIQPTMAPVVQPLLKIMQERKYRKELGMAVSPLDNDLFASCWISVGYIINLFNSLGVKLDQLRARVENRMSQLPCGGYLYLPLDMSKLRFYNPWLSDTEKARKPELVRKHYVPTSFDQKSGEPQNFELRTFILSPYRWHSFWTDLAGQEFYHWKIDYACCLAGYSKDELEYQEPQQQPGASIVSYQKIVAAAAQKALQSTVSKVEEKLDKKRRRTSLLHTDALAADPNDNFQGQVPDYLQVAKDENEEDDEDDDEDDREVNALLKSSKRKARSLRTSGGGGPKRPVGRPPGSGRNKRSVG